MIFAWEEPERVDHNKAPKLYADPVLSFSALIPARHEELVIADTIKAVSAIEYPEYLKEVSVICRSDDEKTIWAVEKTIAELGKDNIRLITVYDLPINKPHSLNIGLANTTKDIITIFDAEDQPHKEIFKILNTVFINEQVDVVQSGVQLMNYRSSWFSTFNTLEYFFWFKSALHFFSQTGATPLGGNTVFFKKKLLDEIGGWDEKCLTEDADIGFRLSSIGAKIRVIYDAKFVTKEETPTNVASFVKQRTRWNQGFIQIFKKGQWLKLPRLTQKILSAYILIWPEFQALFFLLIPLSILMIIRLKLPIVIALLTTIPMYLLLLQLVTYNIGLYEFTKEYDLKYSFWMVIKLLLTFYPYQILLGFSSFRAAFRLISKNNIWEKTAHINAHRSGILKNPVPAYIQGGQ